MNIMLRIRCIQDGVDLRKVRDNRVLFRRVSAEISSREHPMGSWRY